MINIELLFGQFFGAVLTSVLVPNKNLASRKSDMLRGAFVKFVKKHHLRNRDRSIDGSNQMKLIHLVRWERMRQKLRPRIGLKLSVYAVGNVEIKKCHGPLDIRDMDR